MGLRFWFDVVGVFFVFEFCVCYGCLDMSV